MEKPLQSAPTIVVAKMVDEMKPAPETTGGPGVTAGLYAALEPDAAQLRAAATMLLCFSLSQMFTVHGFLGAVASALVVFYAEGCVSAPPLAPPVHRRAFPFTTRRCMTSARPPRFSWY